MVMDSMAIKILLISKKTLILMIISQARSSNPTYANKSLGVVIKSKQSVTFECVKHRYHDIKHK